MQTMSSSSVYPPPPAAMLPPPVPLSDTSISSHSSRKRKRSEGDSAVASNTSSTSHFSKRTKQRIAELNNGDTCWHCGGGAPDICHVIGRRDSSFGTYIDKGLWTFDHLGDEQNGLPLCPSCHRAFDDTNHPGLIFLPLELPFFIDFEVKDYNDRKDVAQRLGHVPPRMVPTAQMYVDHLKRKNLVSQDANGGLYWRYTLRDYFPVNADKSFIPGLGPFKDPGVWHGAPMAVLKRAFQILGDPCVEGIPGDQLEQLWELRKLYARNLSRPSVIIPDTVGTGTAIVAGGQRQSSSTFSSHAGMASSHQPSNVHLTMPSASGSSTIPTTRGTLLRFGPRATTELNVWRYVNMVLAPNG